MYERAEYKTSGTTYTPIDVNYLIANDYFRDSFTNAPLPSASAIEENEAIGEIQPAHNEEQRGLNEAAPQDYDAEDLSMLKAVYAMRHGIPLDEAAHQKFDHTAPAPVPAHSPKRSVRNNRSPQVKLAASPKSNYTRKQRHTRGGPRASAAVESESDAQLDDSPFHVSRKTGRIGVIRYDHTHDEDMEQDDQETIDSEYDSDYSEGSLQPSQPAVAAAQPPAPSPGQLIGKTVPTKLSNATLKAMAIRQTFRRCLECIKKGKSCTRYDGFPCLRCRRARGTKKNCCTPEPTMAPRPGEAEAIYGVEKSTQPSRTHQPKPAPANNKGVRTSRVVKDKNRVEKLLARAARKPKKDN